MFSEEQIAKIFSNIEEIYLFHQKILRQLEECFVEDDPYASEIGAVFLNNVSLLRSLYWEGGGNRQLNGAKSLREAEKERPGMGFSKDRPNILRVAGTTEDGTGTWEKCAW